MHTLLYLSIKKDWQISTHTPLNLNEYISIKILKIHKFIKKKS